MCSRERERFATRRILGGVDGEGRQTGWTPAYEAGNHSLVLFDRGDEISVQAGDEGIRFLLVSGKPIEEPVASVRADCDEHAGAVAAGNVGTANRRIYQASVNCF